MKRSAADIAAWLGARAEEMRHSPTMPERILAEALEGLGFEFQVPFLVEGKNGGMWSYIADAFHAGAALIIEVDGPYHIRHRKGRDRRRDTRFAAMGIRTVRVSNSAVMADVGAVVERIKQEMADA